VTMDETQQRFQLRRRAETMLHDPPTFPTMGRVREELEALRSDLEQALDRADAELAELIGRRADLAARIHACNRALAGTGLLARDDSWAGDRLFWPRAVAYLDPLDGIAAGAEGTAGIAGIAGIAGDQLRTLSSAALQHALVVLLQYADLPLTITDLRRLLTAHHVRPPGHNPPRPLPTRSGARFAWDRSNAEPEAATSGDAVPAPRTHRSLRDRGRDTADRVSVRLTWLGLSQMEPPPRGRRKA